jgi:hypothetical protein
MEFPMQLKSHLPTASALLRVPFLAAALFVGVSSVALALDTNYGQDDQNFKEQAVDAQHKLEAAGYTQVTNLQVEKHGFTAQAVKDGKQVKVEYNERFGIQQD